MSERKPIKRAPELVPLSSEHHDALLLAFQCKLAAHGRELAGARPDLAAQARKVEAAFADKLDAHFRAEEDLLAPALGRHLGADHPEIARLAREHVELQAARRALDGPDLREALLKFGALLDAHVRWEERSFFGLVEATLTRDELHAIGEKLPEVLSPASCARS